MGFFGDDRDRAYNDGGNDGFGILDTLVGLIPGASSGDGGAADYNTSRGRAVSRSATGKASAAAGGGSRSKYNRRRDADDIIDRHSDGGARILHDAELVARDVQCARAQFGAVLYGVLRWKQAAFTVWVAVISALLLVVWCTNLQAVMSVWWSLWNAAWTAVWLLRMALWWALWFVTLGTFNVASPLQPSHAAAHAVQPRSLADAAPPSLEDGGAAEAQYWYLAAAGFCLCQVLSAWCKYALTKARRDVYAPGVRFVRLLLTPSTTIVLGIELVLGVLSMLCLLSAVPGQPLVVACSAPPPEALAPRRYIPEGSPPAAPRMCVDADAAFLLGLGGVFAVVAAASALRTERHVLAFPLLRTSRVQRVKAAVAPSLLAAARLLPAAVAAAAVCHAAVGAWMREVAVEGVAYAASCEVLLVSRSAGSDAELLGGESSLGLLAAALLPVASVLPRLLRLASLLLVSALLGRQVVHIVLTDGVDLQAVAEGVPGVRTSGRHRASAHALMLQGMCQAKPGSVVATFLGLSPPPLTGRTGQLPAVTFAPRNGSRGRRDVDGGRDEWSDTDNDDGAGGAATATAGGTRRRATSHGDRTTRRQQRQQQRQQPRGGYGKPRSGIPGFLTRLMWWRPDPALYTYDDRGAGTTATAGDEFEWSITDARHAAATRPFAGYDDELLDTLPPVDGDGDIAAPGSRRRSRGNRSARDDHAYADADAYARGGGGGSHRGGGGGGAARHPRRVRGAAAALRRRTRHLVGQWDQDDDAGIAFGIGGLGVLADDDAGAAATSFLATESLRRQALDYWRARFNRVEKALYCGDCVDAPHRLPLWQGLARAHAFRYARSVARSDVDGRLEVFAESSGSRWGELLWACTAVVDALTLRLQVVSIRSVAPAASVFRPRRRLTRERFPEWHGFNCLVEQDKWRLGRQPVLREDPDRMWREREVTARFQDGLAGLSALDCLTGAVDSESDKGVSNSQRWGFVPRPRIGGSGGGSASDDGDDGVASSMDPDNHRDLIEHGKQSSLSVLRRDLGVAAPSTSLTASAASLFKRSPQLVTASLFADAQVTMDAIEALAGFAVASRVEDNLGLVQNTLPVVVSSLVACLIAVEEFATSPCFNGGFAGAAAAAEGHSVVRPQPSALKFVLRRAVYSLVHAFGEHNLAPAELVAPRIAARIAAFSHFHE